MRLIDADAFREDVLRAIDDAPLYIQATVDQCIDMAPTVEPHNNDPLALEELREIDGEPVWCVVYNLPKEGYYCLCDKGTIMTPSGSLYDCGDIKDWTFYRRKPEDKA